MSEEILKGTWYRVESDGLVLTRPDLLTIDNAEAALVDLGRKLKGYQWALGHLWIATETKFGEDASQIIGERGTKRRRLATFAWTARKFPKLVELPLFESMAGLIPVTTDRADPLRIRDALSYYHHEAVAGIVNDPEHPEWTRLAARMLDRAEAESLSVEDLEEAVRQLRGAGEGEEVSFDKRPLLARVRDLAEKSRNIAYEMDAGLYGDVRSLVLDASLKLADAAEILGDLEDELDKVAMMGEPS